MCGICGYAGTHRPELLEAMSLVMSHRGPDDMGLWADSDQQVGLGQRRLSIIDLSSAGHQPMPNSDKSIWISYNGEVYNFQKYRKQLISEGYRFRGRSDTEVLVYLYEKYGIDFLNKLNGIFAMAIWDSRKRHLVLARDHAGIKPLYYWQDGNKIYFASEIKALLKIPEIPRQLNYKAVPQYLQFLWVPGEDTMLKSIKKIEPGHYLIWKDGRIELKRWFEINYEPDESLSESDWVEKAHDTLVECVDRQMVSDVPLGAFLSGGTDSSAIVACMRNLHPEREIFCYTARFRPEDMQREQFIDDYPYAEKVGKIFNVNLKSFFLEPDVIKLLPKMIYHLDEPDADPAIFPSYLISKFAREDGTTVLLSGTGGDEVFFGYRSHLAYRKYEHFNKITRSIAGPLISMLTFLTTRLMGADRAVPRRLRKFHRGLIKEGLRRHLAIVDWSSPVNRRLIFSKELTNYAGNPEEIPDCMQRYWDEFRGIGDLNRHSHMLIQTFLSAHNFLYTDKSSMATSVEVRVPFMDVELMKLCASIPERYKLKGSVTKNILKKAIRRYIPDDILYRSKTGFGAPLRKWIANDLDTTIRGLLCPEVLSKRGLFDYKAVKGIIDQNRANKADHAYLIYALLNLELWQQSFIDRPGEEISL